MKVRIWDHNLLPRSANNMLSQKEIQPSGTIFDIKRFSRLLTIRRHFHDGANDEVSSVNVQGNEMLHSLILMVILLFFQDVVVFPIP
ncbi:hypothetical protein GDO78_001761 [Eleutherodactylus coqui]|uniref:Uncharacterized protein n=1 Tax=Eleutherodactylus coqui TaxID=57060 RepID=A0A8J6KJ67_ELECQ|nr:hypothetical protein GDO78_001761 [Eleutherodactylus coqui]